MFRIIIICILLVTSGCAYTVFAQPKVLYSTKNTIGVKYRSSGVQSHDEPGKAMELISDHCNGKYIVTGRAEYDGWTTVDAQCE